MTFGILPGSKSILLFSLYSQWYNYPKKVVLYQYFPFFILREKKCNVVCAWKGQAYSKWQCAVWPKNVPYIKCFYKNRFYCFIYTFFVSKRLLNLRGSYSIICNDIKNVYNIVTVTIIIVVNMYPSRYKFAKKQILLFLIIYYYFVDNIMLLLLNLISNKMLFMSINIKLLSMLCCFSSMGIK